MFLLLACTAPGASTRALTDAGYTDIVVTGWSPFSCGSDDTFSTGFEATNPRGEPVEGVVCCGWVKACTVRH